VEDWQVWSPRVSRLAGIGIVLFGLYEALRTKGDLCPPCPPGLQCACDVGPPTHPHVLLGCLLVLLGVGLLVGTVLIARRWMALLYPPRRRNPQW
jgi:hypothetical protein